MAHSHDYQYYSGCLGYESRVCWTCGLDWNDSPEAIDRAHELALKSQEGKCKR